MMPDPVRLVVSNSPHIRQGDNIKKIMFTVVLAMLPACLAGIWFFGFFDLGARLDDVRALTARNRVTRSLYTASYNKWYFDDLNHLLFYDIGGRVANGVMWFDVKIIDGRTYEVTAPTIAQALAML